MGSLHIAMYLGDGKLSVDDKHLGFSTIDKDMAKKIGMSGLHTIALSLDSIDEERHDFIRGVKGSYSKVMNAIELLNKYAPRTELNLLTIILNLNLVDIIPLIKWVQENDKINMINFLGLVQPRGNEKDSDWHTNDANKVLWPQDSGMLNGVIDAIIAMKNNCPKIGNPVSQLMNYKKYYANPNGFIRQNIRCNMGYLFLSINEIGNATLCEEMNPIGNISRQGISDIWFSQEAQNIRRQIKGCSKNCHQIINCCYQGKD